MTQALASAERMGLVTPALLADIAQRYRGRRGMTLLRTLARPDAQRPFTRSEAEARCLQLLRRAGLPPPHTNVPSGALRTRLLLARRQRCGGGGWVGLPRETPTVRERSPEGQLAPGSRHRGGPPHLAADHAGTCGCGRAGGSGAGPCSVPAAGAPNVMEGDQAIRAQRPVNGPATSGHPIDMRRSRAPIDGHPIEIRPSAPAECSRS